MGHGNESNFFLFTFTEELIPTLELKSRPIWSSREKENNHRREHTSYSASKGRTIIIHMHTKTFALTSIPGPYGAHGNI